MGGRIIPTKIALILRVNAARRGPRHQSARTGNRRTRRAEGLCRALSLHYRWPFATARTESAGIRMFNRPMLAMMIFIGIILAGMYFILPVYNIKVPLP